MVVFETLFLLAGSVAAIAVIGLVAYKGFSGKNTTAPIQHTNSMASTPITTVQTTEAIEELIPMDNAMISDAASEVTHVEQQTAAAPLQGISITTFAAPIITEPIPEAPAPFAEDFIPKTSVPTDVSAIANFASPTDAAIAPVLVIQAPKLKRTRSAAKRRLPTSTSNPGTPGAPSNSSTPTATTIAPRRRRSTRVKTDASTPESTQRLASSPPGINEQ